MIALPKRVLARIAAAALVVVGALTAAGAPARASGEQTDFELTVAGMTLAADAPFKAGWAKITNRGPGVPTALWVTADLSAVDVEHQGFVLPAPDDCVFEEEPLRVSCRVVSVPGVGETREVPLFLFKMEGATTPYQAPVTFTLSSADDTNPDNNTREVLLTFSDESGVDLGVVVVDVKERIILPEGKPAGPLHPGDTTLLHGQVFNWGDTTAVGIKVTVQLPRQVTFAEILPDCVYGPDKRKAVCTYETVVLRPTIEQSDEETVPLVWFPVTVGADVAAPVTLPGGSVTIEALKQLEAADNVPGGAPAQPLPKNIRMVSPASVDANEVDASDNTDGFAVVVDASGGGGGGGGGSLPVTGAQAGLIGGIGLAVLITGGVLVLLTRRRRVVLVTPDDEKSTS